MVVAQDSVKGPPSPHGCHYFSGKFPANVTLLSYTLDTTFSFLYNLFPPYLYLIVGFPDGSNGKKNLPTMQETRVRPLSRKDPLEKGMAIHSGILAWRIPWTEPDCILGITLRTPAKNSMG